MRARGLNANAWAKAAGVAPNALYNLFRGEAKSLNQATLSKLAAAANTDVATMLGLNPRLSDNQARAAEIAAQLSDAVLQSWLELGTRMAEASGLSEAERPFRSRRRRRG